MPVLKRECIPADFIPSDHRPTIRIGIQEFDVIDISERGVRFVNDKKVTQKGWVNGCIVFPGKVSIDVDGVIVRDEDGDMGLHLVAPIDPYPSWTRHHYQKLL